MKTYKVILTKCEIIQAENEQEAEQYFCDNLDLGDLGNGEFYIDEIDSDDEVEK